MRPKKHLGQHFLQDESIALRIVDSLETPVQGQTVVEIGPGMGVLTKYLWKRYGDALRLIEVDPDMVAYLQRELKIPALNILQESFLKVPLDQLPGLPCKVIGNFPYNISSQILFHVLEHRTQVVELVGMFQKEVALRVCAAHGNKAYGILSVLVQAYYETEYLFEVPEHSFRPPPKVRSGVMRMVLKPEPPKVPYEMLAKVVKQAFGQRRKTLRNALKGLEFEADMERFMSLRAEALSVEEFMELASTLS